MPDIQEKRRAAFAALLKDDDTDKETYDDGEEEDPRIYLSGQEKIGRFCVVTLNWSSRGYDKLFYLPIFNDMQAATNRAEEYIYDDLFEELPVKVVDLDTGDVHWAHAQYAWSSERPVGRVLGS